MSATSLTYPTQPLANVTTVSTIEHSCYPVGRFRLHPYGLIGPYRIVKNLGIGGMGEVYQVSHVVSHLNFAAKIAHAHCAHCAPLWAARLRREIELLGHLNHHAIMPIRDLGEQDGVPYFIMPLYTGGSLRDKYHKGPIPLVDGILTFIRLLHGLHHAHNRNVWHRDLKPENVLFDHAGQAVLADFGLARLEGESNRLTGQGMVAGTRAYVAPERFYGADSKAADLWSIGVMLYELWAGQLPFQSGHSLAHGLRHLPRALRDVCLRNLESDPVNRHPSALALADDLQRYLEN